MEVDIEEETEVNIQPVEEFEDLLVSPAPTNQEEIPSFYISMHMIELYFI